MKTNTRLIGMVCAAAFLLILSVSGILWLVFGADDEEKGTSAITAENISVSSDSAENDTDADSSKTAATQSVSESDSADSRAADADADRNSVPKGGMQVSDPDSGAGSGSVSVSDNISFSELTDTESGSSTPQASGNAGNINDTTDKNETENPAPPAQETPEPGNEPADDESSDQELRFGVLE